MSAGSLSRQAARGTAWLGLVNLLSKGSQIVVTLTLGAFLSRADVGAVTIAVVIVNFGVAVQVMGVSDVVSRTRHDPRSFAGTIATMTVTVGVVACLLLEAVAVPLTAAVGAPAAAGPLRVAALGLPFIAYSAVQLGLLHRELDFRRRLLPDAGSAIAGAALTVTLAAGGAGAWSLAAGVLLTAVLSPLLGWAVGVRIGLRWNAEHAAEALPWVRLVGPGAILGVLLLNVDYLVVTQALGEEANGLYSYAYRFAFVPYAMVAIVLSGVAFPVYSRLVADGGPAALRSAVPRFVHLLLVLTGGLYVLMAVLAPRIVVIDERWAPSAPVLQVLCLYGAGFGLLLAGYDALRAAGRPGAYLAAQATHLVLLLGLAVVLVRRDGIVGVAWAQVVAVALLCLGTAAVLVRAGVVDRRLWRTALGPLVAAGVVVLVARGTALVWDPPADSLPGVLALGALLAACYAGVIVAVDRDAVRELRTLSR